MVYQNAIVRLFLIYFISIVQSRFINSLTEHSSSAFNKEMADSENDTLSIKIPDTGANSTQPSDTEGEKEASSAPPVPSVPPPPNGGLKAWLQVAGSFLLVLNTW